MLIKGDSYGYEIVMKVKQLTNEQIKWNEASIYPVLKMLESRGLIKSYWKVLENERPRKYYTILAEGEKQFELSMREWQIVYSLFEMLWIDT